MTEQDDWVQLAVNDDTLVVQLLLKLHHPPSPSPSPSPPHHHHHLIDVSPSWSVRQRRSSTQVSRKTASSSPAAATRASPTTPLSWSGGTTSVSGGGGGGAADGFEESSLTAKTIDAARSKVAVTNQTPTTKRSRKKKTIYELKEEESLLLKETKMLKNQLATLQLTVENQRAANERLKRLKVDLLQRQMPQKVEAAVKTDEFYSIQLKKIKQPCVTTCSIVQISAACNKLETSSSNATCQKQEIGGRESSFMLPDLNLPVED